MYSEVKAGTRSDWNAEIAKIVVTSLEQFHSAHPVVVDTTKLRVHSFVAMLQPGLTAIESSGTPLLSSSWRQPLTMDTDEKTFVRALPARYVYNLRLAFRQMDTNRDGRIDANDVAHWWRYVLDHITARSLSHII